MNNEDSKCGIETATFGAGCFWCIEAIYREIAGVIKVIPGYSGGQIKNPSYEDICTGTTGHAEVCQVIYDALEISYDELLEVFWIIHDPTSLNRQGNDIGTQYRSIILYHNQKQKELAEEYLEMLRMQNAFFKPIVTEVREFETFYRAEDFHVDYYNHNIDDPYSKMVITPKIDKFRKVFKDKLKVNQKTS